MEIILKLNPENITDEVAAGFRIRFAARGVVLDEDNNVALLPVTAGNYHKLPGGGIDEGEDKVTAFRRECMEEIGTDVEVLAEVGTIIEYRGQASLFQTSYCYVGRAIGERTKPTFTQHEMDNGFIEAIWIPLDKAIELVESEHESNRGKFIHERDLFILKRVKELGII